MKKLILTAATVVFSAAHASAAALSEDLDCTTAPSCAELGYTQSASTCSTFGLSYVKCPFDQTKVACNGKVPGYSTVEAACDAEGYKYTAAQCGTQGYDTTKSNSIYRQIGIPCPYSSSYYYCQYPNKNAQAGWYLCGDGTASSTTSGCKSRAYVIGVVLKAPTYRSRGIVALTQNAYYGHGDLFQAWCKGTYSSGTYNYAPGIIGTPRAPDLDVAPSLFRTYFSKIKSEVSYNSSKTINYPLWSSDCWGPTSGTTNFFSCHIIPSSSSADTGASVESNYYGVCVADF